MPLQYHIVLYSVFKRLFSVSSYGHAINRALLYLNYKSINVYYSVSYFILIFATISWLYYELGYVSPVCAYYTGSILPPILKKFKSIGKTYRPTFYLFSSYLQWLYLIAYCRVESWHRIFQFRLSTSSFFIKKLFYKANYLIYNFVLRTFLFSKIYTTQSSLTLREVIEGHNGSIVVLDWYLPKWIIPKCSNCSLFKSDEFIGSISSNSLSKSRALHSHPVKHDNLPNDTKIGNFEHASQKFQNINDESPDSSARIDKSANSNIHQDGATHKSNAYRPADPSTSNGQLNSQSVSSDRNVSEADSCTIQDVPNSPQVQHVTSELPYPKVIRGILVVVGDTNVSYPICYQPVNCTCNEKKVYKKDICKGCATSEINDFEGLNNEPPGIPTIRCLINDAIRSGFVCIHLHLNVNLGMANEAFPGLIGLRCFPISLYSDISIDLNCAFNKISEKFPDLPIVSVGISFGANVLMEYLALSSGADPIVQSDSEQEFYTELGNHIYKQSQSNSTLNNFIANEKPDKSVDTKEEHPIHSSRQTHTLNGVKDGTGFSEAKTPESGLNVDNTSVTDVSSKNSPAENEKSQSSINSILDIDSNYIKQDVFRDNLALSNVLPGSISIDDDGSPESHFGEYKIETHVVFPQPKSKIVFDASRISAVVCINLNLKPANDVLHDFFSAKYEKLNLYKRFCVSAFNTQLWNLFNQVHCNRANLDTHEGCTDGCCHYHNIVSDCSIVKRLSHRFRSFKLKLLPSFTVEAVENIISTLHDAYRQSYIEMKNKRDTYINYGPLFLEKFGARTSSDFKLCVLMVLRHQLDKTIHDGKGKTKNATCPPLYYRVNKRVNTNIRHGSSQPINTQNLKDKLGKFISSAINGNYKRNITNIKTNLNSIKIPTLFLYSMDSSLFNWNDIDIFDVIRNPNIVYYVSKTGGHSTFLSGLRPSVWFVGPTIEFLEEMSTKSTSF